MGLERFNAPGRTRTCDSQFRRLVFYPLNYGRSILEIIISSAYNINSYCDVSSTFSAWENLRS
jgi:hypothetical protein